MSESGEEWLITIKVLRSDTPADVRIRRWLKMGLRAFGLRCTALDVPSEVKRLQRIIEGLADRCTRQSELLTRQAERKAAATPGLASGQRSAPELADGPDGAESTS